ncbi:MAG: secretin and TonB N-terminal domain-containing protein [Candidatus Saganbacteria bacterium]|nr:secretin and TonB N-terminal domain-containing protein [Candidatus Saganbacteria bacterium]
MKKILLLGCCVAMLVNFAWAVGHKIDFEDAAVLDVVSILAKQAGLDLVVSGDKNFSQNKRTSLHLRGVSPEQALLHVLKANGLAYERQGSALLVSMLAQDQTNVYRGEIATINLKFLMAEKVSRLILRVLPGLKASASEAANAIVIQGKPRLINEARKLIYSIDRPIPQVLIESKVLEISESDSMRLGLSYGAQPGVFKFITDKDTGKTTLADNLQTTLNALISTGQAKVVACPKIATLNNHSAVINIGQRMPYAVPVTNGSNSTQWTVDYIDAGVKLKITPCVGEEGAITALIQPEVSSVSEWRTTAAGEFPVITTRNAQSTLRVANGETIVVGGLLSEMDRENISRLPILGYLPVLGLFFQNKTIEKTKTEIVFLITPHII